MDLTNHLDASTLFLVNAVSLAVFAVTYIFAWCGQSNRAYWAALTISNILFSIAFIMFSWLIDAEYRALLLPNCLIILGLGVRWQAVRVFFGHRPSYLLPSIFTVMVFCLLYLENRIGTGVAFSGVNIVISLQIAIIIYALVSERAQDLPSRWGLAAAYGIVFITSAIRATQGWMLDQGMSSLLPADAFLHAHLFSAAIHIVASGAFSLSMAYEQSAVELRQAALCDALTGLPNRMGLESRLKSSFRFSLAKCAVFVIDIDSFKRINDTYGHGVGDVVIHHCGQVISRHLRDTDFVARIGGEEFLVIIAHTSPPEALQIAERIRLAMARECVEAGEDLVRFTVSAGIAYTENPRLSFTHMMMQADQQLYKAKAEGRNCVRATVCA